MLDMQVDAIKNAVCAEYGDTSPTEMFDRLFTKVANVNNHVHNIDLHIDEFINVLRRGVHSRFLPFCDLHLDAINTQRQLRDVLSVTTFMKHYASVLQEINHLDRNALQYAIDKNLCQQKHLGGTTPRRCRDIYICARRNDCGDVADSHHHRDYHGYHDHRDHHHHRDHYHNNHHRDTFDCKDDSLSWQEQRQHDKRHDQLHRIIEYSERLRTLQTIANTIQSGVEHVSHVLSDLTCLIRTAIYKHDDPCADACHKQRAMDEFRSNAKLLLQDLCRFSRTHTTPSGQPLNKGPCPTTFSYDRITVSATCGRPPLPSDCDVAWLARRRADIEHLDAIQTSQNNHLGTHILQAISMLELPCATF